MLREVCAGVADGTGLSEAMAQHPRAFDELAVTMIRAGQEGGFLEDVLRHIADYTEQQEDLKSKVLGALAYPIFLAGAGFVILNVLVIFFVPQFEPMYKRMAEKGELPSITVGLLAFSHFMQAWGWAVAIAVFVGFYFFRRWGRTPKGRLLIDGFRLRLPVAGKIYLSFALSRFTRFWVRYCTTAFLSLTPSASARTRPAIRCFPRRWSAPPTISRPANRWPRRFPLVNTSRAT